MRKIIICVLAVLAIMGIAFYSGYKMSWVESHGNNGRDRKNHTEHIDSDIEDLSDGVAVGRYKLAALKELEGITQYAYDNENDPNRQCVMLSLSSEFTGKFIFFAQTIPGDILEVVCFTPKHDSSREWFTKWIKFEGVTKKNFELLHDSLLIQCDFPRSDKDGDLPTHGDNYLAFKVGSGDELKWGEVSSKYLSKNLDRGQLLQECISLAESLSNAQLNDGFQLPNN